MNESTLNTLLESWERNYKKGLLTFWLLLLLHEQEAYAFEMNKLMAGLSQGSVKVDENSIYRALNRFTKMGIVESSWQDSDLGPRRRYYRLTPLGQDLLGNFIHRNIVVFQSETVSRKIQAVLEHLPDPQGKEEA